MKVLLLILGLVFGAVLLLQWHDWPPQPPRPPAAAGDITALVPESSDAQDFELMPPPSREEYASITERPLFLPDRRPPPEEPDDGLDDTPPESFTELAGMDLNAVVITPSSVSAWVRTPNSRELVRLRLGDDFEGWTVTGIEPQRLLLERQGDGDELILRDYQNAPPPIPPTPTPRANGRPPTPGSASADRRQPDGETAAARPNRTRSGVRLPPLNTNASRQRSSIR